MLQFFQTAEKNLEKVQELLLNNVQRVSAFKFLFFTRMTVVTKKSAPILHQMPAIVLIIGDVLFDILE